MYQSMCQKNEFWYLCDSETMSPPLLSLRYCEAEIHKKQFSTQRAELQAVQFFYAFWLDKFGETLDYSLYKSNFQDIESLIDELEPFWDYLVAGRILNLCVLFTDNVNTDTTKLATHSTRALAVIRFIKFLIKTYIDSRYTNLSKTEILQHRKLLEIKLEAPQFAFQKYIKDSSAKKNQLHSLTAEQCHDFLKVVRPNTVKKPNPLNPNLSRALQIRNYVMWLLILRYGLRPGEVLLLQRISFKPYFTDPSKFLMVVQNLESEDDTRSQKPSIKTPDSTRNIDISKEHYDLIIGLYYNNLRATEEQSGHDFIFTSSVKPYGPLSYRAMLKAFERSAESFKENFPEHFDIEFSDAITRNVTPHWLRHTWAFSTLAQIHKETEEKFIKTKIVKISGIMEDSIEQLRVLGGWAVKSRMPSYYAARFIQGSANMTLLNIFNSTLIYDEDIEF